MKLGESLGRCYEERSVGDDASSHANTTGQVSDGVDVEAPDTLHLGFLGWYNYLLLLKHLVNVPCGYAWDHKPGSSYTLNSAAARD